VWTTSPTDRDLYRLTVDALTLECRTRELAEAVALAMAERAGVCVYLRHPQRGLEFIGDRRPCEVCH